MSCSFLSVVLRSDCVRSSVSFRLCLAINFVVAYSMIHFQAVHAGTSSFRLIEGHGMAVIEHIKDVGCLVGHVAGYGRVFPTALVRVVAGVRRGTGDVLFRDIFSVHPAFPFFLVTE